MHWARVERTSPKSSIFNFNTTYRHRKRRGIQTGEG
jgi:hypothetical protein